MPRKSYKKKKGKVVRPGMEQAVQQKVVSVLNDKLADLGLGNLAVPQPAKQTEESKAPSGTNSSAALNESAYTYYSESVN